MSTFHKLKIKEVRKETPDAVSVHWDIPESVQSDFKYKPGQYLTLKLTVEGEELRRAYSLCTSPYSDNIPAIAVKRVEGGKVSNYINDWFNAGTEVEVMTPMGNFTTELNEFFSRHFYLYAGGSGITPMMSILKSVLEGEPSSQVTLFYGNRDEESIIFKEELDELEGHFADRFKIVHSLENYSDDWEGERGMMTREKVGLFLEKYAEEDLNRGQHFICGPGQMMEEVKSALRSNDVEHERIHIEYFSSNIAQNDEDRGADSGMAEEDQGDFSGKAKVKIELQGDDFELEVKEDQTILSVAQEKGIDPPYACQMGICTTCRAKLLKGSVHMNETEGLTDEEMKQDYILTCQSHPRSNNIEIRYE